MGRESGLEIARQADPIDATERKDMPNERLEKGKENHPIRQYIYKSIKQPAGGA